MKPRKVKEDDAPRTIACPHKVSSLMCPSLSLFWPSLLMGLKVLHFVAFRVIGNFTEGYLKALECIDFYACTRTIRPYLN